MPVCIVVRGGTRKHFAPPPLQSNALRILGQTAPVQRERTLLRLRCGVTHCGFWDKQLQSERTAQSGRLAALWQAVPEELPLDTLPDKWDVTLSATDRTARNRK